MDQVKRIVDYSNGKVVNITLWTQKSLEAIRINSGELASSNEYQVHYWALSFVFKSLLYFITILRKSLVLL